MSVASPDHWLSIDNFVFTTNHIKITEKGTSLNVQTHKDGNARRQSTLEARSTWRCRYFCDGLSESGKFATDVSGCWKAKKPVLSVLVECHLRSRYTLTGRYLEALTLWRGLKTVDNRELGCFTRIGWRGHFLRTHGPWSLPPHPVSSAVSKRQSTSQLPHKGNA